MLYLSLTVRPFHTARCIKRDEGVFGTVETTSLRVRVSCANKAISLGLLIVVVCCFGFAFVVHRIIVRCIGFDSSSSCAAHRALQGKYRWFRQTCGRWAKKPVQLPSGRKWRYLGGTPLLRLKKKHRHCNYA